MPQLATFFIGAESFALDILLMKEIGKLHEITKVPEAPDFFLGLMNLRGQVVTIMDLGIFLEQPSEVNLSERRIVILKNEDELAILRRNGLLSDISGNKDPLAIVIDRIGEVINISEKDILPPPPNLAGAKKEFVAGVLQNDEQLIIILAMGRLLKKCASFGSEPGV